MGFVQTTGKNSKVYYFKYELENQYDKILKVIADYNIGNLLCEGIGLPEASILKAQKLYPEKRLSFNVKMACGFQAVQFGTDYLCAK